MTRSSRDAWTDFWTADGGRSGGCLADVTPAIEAVQRQQWEAAAGPLPRGARVLDLASGDGVVLGHIRRVRPDLKLTGVDSAERLPPAPKGVTLRGGIQMESLPFGDGQFQLVTSQFGFEYGDVAQAAKELRRVLAQGERFHFIVHHRDSAIVAHNLARRDALRWAARDSGYLSKAAAFATARKTAAFLPTPAYFRQAPREVSRLFPTQPVAAEFVLAIFQTLEGGRYRSPVETIEVLGDLDRRASGELARLDELDSAARDQVGIGGIARSLTAAGLDAETAPLNEQGTERPFAWLVRSAG